MTNTANRPATAVVFDLGGVLVQWSPQVILERALTAAASREAVRMALFEHDDWLALDRGTLSEEEAIARAADRTGESVATLGRLMEIVRDSLAAMPDTVALLEELHHQGVPLYCLSNMHRRSIEHLRQRYRFFSFFRQAVISCEVQLIKPEPAVFAHLLAACALEAPRTVFVDDHPANCRAAAAAGLRTILFTDAASCRQQLESALTGRPDSRGAA